MPEYNESILEDACASLIADGCEEAADAIRALQQEHKPYDPVDAAYIMNGLLVIRRRSKFNTELRGQGQLEELHAIWETSLEAAQAIYALVHPDEYDRLAVFAYEMLAETSTLPAMLWADRCQNPETVVEAWMRQEKIRFKNETQLERAHRIIRELLDVGDDMSKMTRVHREASEFLQEHPE